DGGILTSDKDMSRLLSPAGRIYDAVKARSLTEEDCLARFGVEPARVVEVMGLMGDATDNIPGVKGIGEKTAKKLIAEFGTIENLLDRLTDVKGQKLRLLLAGQAEEARQSGKLATILIDSPVVFDKERIHAGQARSEELSGLFRELEFWAFLKSLQADTGVNESHSREPVRVLEESSSCEDLAEKIFA